MTTKTRQFVITLFVFATLTSGTFLNIRAAPAATIVVNTLADELNGASGNKACSLREAIANANNDNKDQDDCIAGTGNDIITLPVGTYTLIGAAKDDANLSGDLDIWGNLVINGASAKTTIIQAGTSSPVDGTCSNCVDRVLHILDSSNVTINNVTIRYGKSPNGTSSLDGAGGGGIYNFGSLTLNNSVVMHNRSGDGYDNSSGNGGYAGPGGGIFTQGSLTLSGISRVSNNRTGDGGDGGTGGVARWGGYGGGIYAVGSYVVTLTDATVSENATGNGGRGGDSAIGNAGNGSGGGYGGGIYCNFCTLNMTNTTLRLNRTGDGGNGGNATIGNGTGGNGGSGGYGAGGFWSSATVTVSDSRIQDNQTGLGGDGGTKSGTGTEGSDGSRGGGGGLFLNTDANVSITSSTISSNSAGSGGGISNNDESDVSIYNTTISGNHADEGGGGLDSSSEASMELTFVTITDNIADFDGDDVGDGGGFWYYDPFTMTNSIIANNVSNNTSVTGEHDDCRGNNITSQDYNLVGIGDSADCIFTPQAHDLVGTMALPLDPHLALLADYGGLTRTHALLAGSPAIDQIPNGVNGCVSGTTEDQRGVIRYAPCDIGAFEGVWYYIYLPLVLR
jgi:CSLREA domain-containing protein